MFEYVYKYKSSSGRMINYRDNPTRLQRFYEAGELRFGRGQVVENVYHKNQV